MLTREANISYDPGGMHPKYSLVKTRRTVYLNGRQWVQIIERGPLSSWDDRGIFTVQGIFYHTWTFGNDDNFAAVSHVSRQMHMY